MIQTSLYRAVWRWHFFAGLLILPILVILAITGAIYLFKDELHHLTYRGWIEAPVREAPVASADAVQRSLERALGGELVQVTMPEAPGRTIQALVRLPNEVRHVYADPYSGEVVGSHAYGGPMRVVAQLHSLALVGSWANALVEVAAGWAIIMVGTGIFLWWPRGAAGGVVTIRSKPSKRLFWRDLHAVTGAFAGSIIVFLAITGLPWSMFWGDKLHGWVVERGIGTPEAPAGVPPYWSLGNPKPAEGGHEGHGPVPAVPWAMEGAAIPRSHGHAGHAMGLDAAMARFDALGLPRPYGVQPPDGPSGVYAAVHTGDAVEDTRMVYLDQRTGEVLDDVTFADYGAGAKAIEWGIAVHQGHQYGEANRYLMLSGCLAILALAASSVAMWWKRRPAAGWGIPPAAQGRKAALVVLAIIAGVSVLFPLTGLSLIAAVLIDRAVVLVVRNRRNVMTA